MTICKIVSWNIAGCHNVVKRKKILTYLKQKKTELAMIQETHLDEEESLKLKRDWVGQVYFSTFNSRKRGVVILVKRNLDFQVFKHYADKDGRWVILDAALYGQKMTVVNIYAPNSPQPDFFHNICNLIRNIGNTDIVIGGDFNQVRDVFLDKSSKPRLVHDPTCAALDVMSEELALVDIWRVLHPQERDYTFYSHPHSTYSRIDYFLISRSLVGQTIGSSIGNIVVTDHAPIELLLSSKDTVPSSPRWRLNNSLLHNENYCEYIRLKMSEFWECNEGSIEDVGLTWDAFKAYLRGCLIQYSSLMKKAQREEILRLENDIKALEKEHISHPSEEIWNKLIKLKFDLNSILQKKVEHAMFCLNQKYFEQGEKTGKLLAHRVRQIQCNNLIPSIFNEDNNKLTTDKLEISEVFTKFYKDLYTSNGHIEEPRLSEFFSSIKTPTLAREQKTGLEEVVSIIEIKKAIKSLRLGKSPGNDGFPSDFYRIFVEELAPRLLAVYTDALERGRLPPSMRSAVITLLHKKGKDPQYCGNYRPISLINVDEKIISKVLAMRLEKVLPSLVHVNQVGFVKHRCSADNLRRILHVIWKCRNNPDPVVAFSLDAQKAFDKVEFAFLFYTLRKFGFGRSFMQWLKLVYTDPMATVLTNGIMSPSFSLGRGTRQGSPLSPLIFALFLEPLAIALRDCKHIQGVNIGQEEQKLFLYADDILLISSNPDVAVQAMSSIIDSFSEISGYTINWTKSEAMPLSKMCPPAIRGSWQFKWMPMGMTYLGIKLTPGLDKIMQVNINPIIQNIKTLLQNWSKINLSLLGRINLVKMIIAPKIQYIMYMLPLSFPPSLFKLYNNIVEDFVWVGKKTAFNRSKLYAAKIRGGLALSKMDWYHYAFSLSQLAKMYKLYTFPDQRPSWVNMEEGLVAPATLEAFLTQNGRRTPCDDPVLAFAQETWLKAYQFINICPFLSSKASIWFNKKLLIDKKTFMWEKWSKSGINLLGDVFTTNGIKTFVELKQEFNLEQKEYWKYLQLAHCIRAKLKSVPDPPSGCQEVLMKPGLKKASTFYHLIREARTPKLEGLRLCWERDLGVPILEDSWKWVVESWYSCSQDTQSQLIQYKLLHRKYWTPSKLAKLKLMDNDTCWKCQKETGTLIHMLYECEKNADLWKGIVNLLCSLLQCDLTMSPDLCIFGLLPDNINISKRYKLWIRLVTVSGCRIILRHWKSPTPCSFKEWTELLTRIALYERVTFNVRGKAELFDQIWGPFLRHIENM